MARNCPDAAAPVLFLHRGGSDSPFYNIRCTIPAIDFRPAAGSRPGGTVLCEIDTKEMVLGSDNLPIPLQYALSQSYREKEVF